MLYDSLHRRDPAGSVLRVQSKGASVTPQYKETTIRGDGYPLGVKASSLNQDPSSGHLLSLVKVKEDCEDTRVWAWTCPRHSGNTPLCPHGPNPREGHVPRQPPAVEYHRRHPGRGITALQGGWRGSPVSHSATPSPPSPARLPQATPGDAEAQARPLFRLSGTGSTRNWAWSVSEFGLRSCAASGE